MLNDKVSAPLVETLTAAVVSSVKTLYTHPACGESILRQVSLFKFAYPSALKQISGQLSKLIQEDIGEELKSGEWHICTQPSPILHTVDLLVEKLSASLNVPVIHLKKLRSPKDYANLRTSVERRSTISGSIALSDDDPVRGKNIILVDDILNTSNVLREMCRVLYQGEAKSVSVYVVMRIEGGDALIEIKINELALENDMPAILEMINSGVPLTTTLFKALLRMFSEDPEKFRIMVQTGLDDRGKENVIKTVLEYEAAGISAGIFSKLSAILLEIKSR